MKTSRIATFVLVTALALVGVASPAAATEDACNGIIDRGGCKYVSGNIEYYCSLWVTVAGCIDGSQNAIA